MVIYLQHEKHGRMPVYSESEAAVHAKNGWYKIDINAKPVEPVSDESTEVVAPRRGRPPKER